MSDDYLQVSGLRKLVEEDIEQEQSMEDAGNFSSAIYFCKKIIANLNVIQKLDGGNPSYTRLLDTWNKRLSDLETHAGGRKDSIKTGGKNKSSKGYIAEMETEFRERILSLISESPVKWDSIGGLRDQKDIIREAVFFAMAVPDRQVEVPNLRNILLFGPPGTGKTSIARAVSSNINATFFNVPISELVSRYVGDSERIISTLYEVAREKSPSVIFIDEIEALLRTREDHNRSSGNILQQFLSQLDGFSTDKHFIMTLAATNVPWELDSAILSRFEKRIYIGLPDEETRESILKIQTTGKGYQVSASLKEIARKTGNFSGRDLSYLCSEAIRNMLRRTNKKIIENSQDGVDVNNMKYKVSPITQDDFVAAMARIKPALQEGQENKYIRWKENFANS